MITPLLQIQSGMAFHILKRLYTLNNHLLSLTMIAKSELPTYLAAAEGVAPPCEWWKHHNKNCSAKLPLFNHPLLQASFGKQQEQSLERRLHSTICHDAVQL